VSHYLVITHRTATSPELAESLTRLREADSYSAFTLLVTATHHPLVEQNAWIEAQARQRGEEARRQLQEAGVYLTRVVVGAGSPSVAAKDELIARPDTYDAIVLHTRPPGLRDRATGDLRRRIEQETGVPVFHAYRGSEEPWRADRTKPMSRLGRLWQRTRFEERARPGELPGQPHAPSRREMLPVLAFMLLYLAGGLTLALTVNRGFYLNDVVALIIYTVVIGGLLFVMSREL
jgi:hypothetical protein